MRHHLNTLATRRSAQRAAAVAAIVGAGAFAVPAGATGDTASALTARSTGAVRAVVVVRAGVALPLAVPGGRVVATFPHLGSELVSAPVASLQGLSQDARVAGVSPDRAGRVTGLTYGNTGGVLAPVAVGGDAGKRGVGYHVNVALLDTGLTDTAALNRASGRVTDGVDVSHLASGGAARTSGHFTDGYGHGTFLASLIAGGSATRGGPTVGIAPSARIVVVKVANDRGRTTLSEVLAGMDVQALTVGAADVSGKTTTVAKFSGRGTVAGVVKPDVVAPGVHMLGVMPTGTYIYKSHPEGRTSGGMFKGSGTSEATAVASGVAAAYYSHNLDAAPKQAKAAVRDAARALHKSGAGAGLVQMVGASGAQAPASDAGESHFNASSWSNNAWQNGNWVDWLASSWSASSWSASSWSASSWSASSWSDYSWGR